MGIDGFDIDDIAWTKANFEAEKAFLLKVIDEATKELGWEMLAYKPTNMKEKLLKFRELIDAYEKSFVDKEEWGGSSIFEEGEEFQICPIHKVYKYERDGCPICNTVIYSSS
jgi:hypothetical protein